jgi:hypothetical protein
LLTQVGFTDIRHLLLNINFFIFYNFNSLWVWASASWWEVRTRQLLHSVCGAAIIVLECIGFSDQYL